MPETVGIELRAQPLGDDVDEVVLEVLGDAGDERHSDGCSEEEAHTTDELPGRVVTVPGGVLVNDMAEYQGIEKREDLVHRRQEQGEEDELPVAAQITVEDSHYR